MSEVAINERMYCPFQNLLNTGGRKAITLPNTPSQVSLSPDYVTFIVDTLDTPDLENSLNALAEDIKQKRASAEIDKEQNDLADRSADDAAAMVLHSRLNGRPRVMFSSDGILTLEWHRGNEGAALIFAGDGKAAVVLRRSGALYDDCGQEIGVRENLPADFVNMITRLS
jgi:hypothetical protein